MLSVVKKELKDLGTLEEGQLKQWEADEQDKDEGLQEAAAAGTTMLKKASGLAEKTFNAACEKTDQLGDALYGGALDPVLRKTTEVIQTKVVKKIAQKQLDMKNTHTIPDSESEILRNSNLNIEEKIAEIIADVESDEEEEEKQRSYSDTFLVAIEEEENITKAIDDYEVGHELADGATNTTVSSTQPVGRHRRMLACERQFLLDYAGKPVQELAVCSEAVESHVQNLLYIFNHILSYGCRSSYWELLTQHYGHDSIRFVNE